MISRLSGNGALKYGPSTPGGSDWCRGTQSGGDQSLLQHLTFPMGTSHTCTAQHSTAQHSTAQHSTAQHSTAQHSTAQHSTARHRAAPVSTWKMVVFPAPFTPRRPKHSPCPTMALMPVTARTGGRPPPTGYDFFKPSNSTGYWSASTPAGTMPAHRMRAPPKVPD